MERLWERNREERKETNRKAEYLESDGRYGKPDRKKEEKRESESGTEKLKSQAARRNSRKEERKNAEAE